MINESIAKLVKYGENAGLVSGLDKIYATNRILEVMQISDYEEPEQIPETPDLEETLNELLDDAAKRGLLEHNSVVYRDLFDTKLMDCLMPRPGEVVKKFEELYAKSPQEATDYFYKLSQDSNYIRRYRIKGYPLERTECLRRYRYLDQPLQTGEGPEGDRGCKTGKTERLSEMPALQGECGLCGTRQPPGAPEPPHHSADDQSDGVGIPVLAICVLQ